MSEKHIITGSMALDWIITAEGEVKHMVCGGNALYAAVGASIWSKSIYVNSKVGYDFPFTLLSAFDNTEIDLSGIKRASIPHSILSGYRYDQDGERTYFNMPKELTKMGLQPETDQEEHFWSRDWDQLDDPELNIMPEDLTYDWHEVKSFCICSTSFDIQSQFSSLLSQKNFDFTVDPGRPVDEEMLAPIKNMPIYLPSQGDIGILKDAIFGEASNDFLLSLGPKILGIKLGRSGSIVYDLLNKEKHIIPVYPVNSVDPTGAGDAFAGGFSVCWSKFGDVLEAGLRATVSSSFVVEHFDVRNCISVDPIEAEKRLRKLRSEVITIPLN